MGMHTTLQQPYEWRHNTTREDDDVDRTPRDIYSYSYHERGGIIRRYLRHYSWERGVSKCRPSSQEYKQDTKRHQAEHRRQNPYKPKLALQVQGPQAHTHAATIAGLG